MGCNAQSGISLTQLFGEKVFRIPDYQRGYAWTVRQLNELWLDIEDVVRLPSGELQKHFTGTVFVESMPTPEADSWLFEQQYYTVVDGQQRLTTLVILMFELWKRLDDEFEYKDIMRRNFIVAEDKKGISKVYRFSYLGESEKYLKKIIFEDETIRGDVGPETVYTRNLFFAKNFFADRLSKMSRVQLEELYRKLVTALRFDFRPIDDLDVQAVFETMNNRGKPLTVLEKLKNRLMYLTEKLVDEDAHKKILRGQIRDSWGEVYRKLGQNPDHVLDEDDFISAHLSLYRIPQESTFSIQLAEKKLFEMFSLRAETYPYAGDDAVREPKVTYDKIAAYIADLESFAGAWYDIHNTANKLEYKVLRLNQSKEIKIFLCAIRIKCKSGESLDGVLDLVERTLFRNRVPGAAFKDEGTFATLARDVYAEKVEIGTVEAQMKSDMVAAPINAANIAHGFAGLFDYQRGNKGFHRWGALKYFLFEYEAWRRNVVREYGDIITLGDYDDTSIEHIIPQDYSANWGEVMSRFTECVPANMEKGVDYSIKVLLNTIGNLMLIRKQKNSSLQNDPWTNKRSRYKTGTYNEREVADHEIWTATEIDCRGRGLLEFLAKKLGISPEAFTPDLRDQMLYNNKQIADAVRQAEK